MMTFIRYLLSHFLLLIFIAAIVAAYIYRTQLFSEDIVSRVDGSVYKIRELFGLAKPGEKPVTITQSEKKDVSEDESTIIDLAESNGDIAASSESGSETDVETKSEATPEPAEETVANAQTDITEKTTDSVVPSVTNSENKTTAEEAAVNKVEPSLEPKVDDTKQTAIPEMLKQPKEVAVAETQQAKAEDISQETAVTTDKDATANTNTDLLNQARFAYQQNQADKAISLYQELADLNPDDPNAYGEMGNVYYSQGKWKLAGQAYYEAAVRLMKQGNMRQVHYLYRVIQGLDADSAEKLRTELK